MMSVLRIANRNITGNQIGKRLTDPAAVYSKVSAIYSDVILTVSRTTVSADPANRALAEYGSRTM